MYVASAKENKKDNLVTHGVVVGTVRTLSRVLNCRFNGGSGGPEPRNTGKPNKIETRNRHPIVTKVAPCLAFHTLVAAVGNLPE